MLQNILTNRYVIDIAVIASIPVAVLFFVFSIREFRKNFQEFKNQKNLFFAFAIADVGLLGDLSAALISVLWIIGMVYLIYKGIL